MFKIQPVDQTSKKIITPAIMKMPCSPFLPLRPNIHQNFVTGQYKSAMGTLPQISSKWTRNDWQGAIKARWGINRMDYLVDPGLYALGEPDANDPVLVSANYKLSFDVLKKALPEKNAWILVLDTKGINVWCAAGKGTFGTQELIYRIQTSGISQVVNHRKIIVPQLGAPGIAAHEIKKETGFKVHWGPVRASDLPYYLENKFTATKQMRQVTFGLRDRIVLIPMELTMGIKPFILITLLFMLLATLAGFIAGTQNGLTGFSEALLTDGFKAVGVITTAFIAGAVIHPLIMPYLPAKAFSLQGMIMGAIISISIISLRLKNLTSWEGLLEAAGWLLIFLSITAFMAMNFTGSSTYTSLSGVKKEMSIALPLEITSFIVGSLLWLLSLALKIGGTL